MPLEDDDYDYDEPDQTLIICQGPPVCHLSGDACLRSQLSGCVWCRRVIQHEDFTETVIEPTRQ